MISNRLAVFSLLLAGLAGTSGCLSKTELPPPRYFRPGALPAPAAPAATGERSPLRLREVTAAEHLDERMVWTTSREYGFYEEALWTERPAAYVEAGLSRALFEQGAFRRATGAQAPVLDVRVTAFEEVITGDAHSARVALHLVLSDPDGQALVERTVVGAEPVASNDPADVAQAMGAALERAIAAAREAVGAAR